MKKILCCLLVLGLLLSTSGALAQTVTTELMKLDNGVTIVLHHEDGVEVIADRGEPGYGFWTITDNAHAPVTLGICLSEIHGDLSLADLTEEEREQYTVLLGFMFENPIIHLDTTPSGNMYLHLCANESPDVDSIFTIYKGAIVELIQHSLDNFGQLMEEDKAFCFNVLYGIEFVEE